MGKNTFGNYKCPCCGYYTLSRDAGNTFEICPVCFWEDDGFQLDNVNYEGGANHVSLNEARENFRAYGAMEERFKTEVRPPLEDEL